LLAVVVVERKAHQVKPALLVAAVAAFCTTLLFPFRLLHIQLLLALAVLAAPPWQTPEQKMEQIQLDLVIPQQVVVLVVE